MISNAKWVEEPLIQFVPKGIKVGYFPAGPARKVKPDQMDSLRCDIDKLLTEYDFLMLCTNELLKVGDMINYHLLLNDYDKKFRLIYMCSSGSTEVMDSYYTFCNQMGWEPLKIFIFNHCQLLPQPNVLLKQTGLIHLDHYDRSKIFNCLNYGVRHHRDKVVADIFLNNLDKHGYVTYGDIQLPEYISRGVNHTERYVNFFNENRDMFPMTLDNPHEFIDRCSWTPELVNLTNDSFLNVCVESFYYDFHDLSVDEIIQSLDPENLSDQTRHERARFLTCYLFPYNKCITEKCLRPFITGTIGLYHTTAHTVDILRKDFDVFDDIVDHSYDTEIDADKRHDMFMTEMQRLCGIQMHTWRKIYRDTLDRRRANLALRLQTFEDAKSNILTNVNFAQDPNDLVKLMQE